jgi:hypothetical protein
MASVTRDATLALTRPVPPHFDGLTTIAPAPELKAWMLKTFVEPDGKLYNEEHGHLALVDFGCLWADTSYAKQGRIVLGLTEQVTFRVSGWPRWRQEQQLMEWFDGQVPAFLITLSAAYCREADEAEFCALVEHELYHIGHKRDEFGNPAFTDEGIPKLYVRGHDVEEFVGVVRRYGVGHPGGALAQLVQAANAKPEVGRLKLQQACGTCMLRAA